MQRYDLRHLHDNFYERMGELIESGLRVGEVGIFLFEVGDFSSIQKSADFIKEAGHDLMNSVKFNEVDWTLVMKKVSDDEIESRKVAAEEASKIAEEKRIEAEKIATEKAEAKAKADAEKAAAEAKAKEEAEKAAAEAKAKEEAEKAAAEAKAKEEAEKAAAEAKAKEEAEKAAAEAKAKEEAEKTAPVQKPVAQKTTKPAPKKRAGNKKKAK